jgi:hypothetical protein
MADRHAALVGKRIEVAPFSRAERASMVTR